jgi:OOP family OmpA-OmpF porin
MRYLVLLLTLLLTATAQADGYFGIGFGRSKADVKADVENVLGAIEGVPFGTPVGLGETWSSDAKDSATGYRVFIGNQINQNFAVEGGYVDLGRFLADASLTVPGFGTDTLAATVKARGFDLGLIGFAPVTEQFSFLGRVGIFLWDVRYNDTFTNFLGSSDSISESASGNSLSYGLGAKYDFSKSVSLRGEFQRFTNVGNKNTTGQSDVDLLSVSLISKF